MRPRTDAEPRASSSRTGEQSRPLAGGRKNCDSTGIAVCYCVQFALSPRVHDAKAEKFKERLCAAAHRTLCGDVLAFGSSERNKEQERNVVVLDERSQR